jgi:hypothetical protein
MPSHTLLAWCARRARRPSPQGCGLAVLIERVLATYRSGIRNTVGWDFHAASGKMYFTDNGMDSLGDNAPGGVGVLVACQSAALVLAPPLILGVHAPCLRYWLLIDCPLCISDCELNRLTGPFPQEFGHPYCYS